MAVKISQLVRLLVLMAMALSVTRAQLYPNYYWETCPQVESIVAQGLGEALQSDPRIGASLLRVHFHDCFVQGCDGSILLVDTPSFQGEQSARPNAGSLRGFPVVDTIKASVEAACPGIVSCADILAIIASHSVMAAGGVPWALHLGRRDSLTASFSLANANLPNPLSNVSTLTSKFDNVGLDQNDMVTLSGAHTFGKAQCGTFLPRLYNFSGNNPDPTINTDFLQFLQSNCPQGGPTTNTVFLDQGTPLVFDNYYYKNLQVGEGVLLSDQTLKSEGGPTAALSDAYADDFGFFYAAFTDSLTKMSSINPLTGSSGEIRQDCKFRNSDIGASSPLAASSPVAASPPAPSPQ